MTTPVKNTNSENTISTIIPEYEKLPETPQKKEIFHPVSAIVTLGMDVLFFGADSATMGVSLPVSMVLAFTITFGLSFMAQRRLLHDTTNKAFMKALFLGIMAGIPFPVAGSAVGLYILSMAGLRKIFFNK